VSREYVDTAVAELNDFVIDDGDVSRPMRLIAYRDYLTQLNDNDNSQQQQQHAKTTTGLTLKPTATVTTAVDDEMVRGL
jgi:hypothetical protein